MIAIVLVVMAVLVVGCVALVAGVLLLDRWVDRELAKRWEDEL